MVNKKGFFGLLFLYCWTATVFAYPLDGFDYTGIKRLEFYRLAQTGEVSGRKLLAGAQASLAEIKPRLVPEYKLAELENDPDYKRQLVSFLGKNKSRYGVAVIDLSNPDQPIFAAHNPDYKSNVGSVGKMVVATAVFQALATIYPDDIAARERVLRQTEVTADKFIQYDDHKVPLWDIEKRKLRFRPLRVGDRGSLWEYMDWSLSASSNAAASMLIRELLLLREFGREYPVSDERATEYLNQSEASVLRASMLAGLDSGLADSGVDLDFFRQGSFFTRYGKNRIGGRTSYGTPDELIKFLLKIEQGKLVDEFSSRELKRMIYMTQKRIRYASHPALKSSAVYFKSGSLYSCVEEAGFKCGKYQGNRRNVLASVAIVETEKPGRDLHYLVVVVSNVLRENSAVAHQTLALRIHRMIEKRQLQSVPEVITANDEKHDDKID